MISTRPAHAYPARVVGDSYDRLCAGLRADQAATPTARAANELDRTRVRLSGIAFLHLGCAPEAERRAWPLGQFHCRCGER